MYGGFGCSKGGIFPNGFKLAAAITATGRGWICTVKRIIESSMWVGSGQRFGIGEKPEDCSYVRVVYGDTDSVFCHLDSLCLHAAGAFGDQISDYFSKQVLPYPQKLEFEKVYYPFVLYRKKMYSGAKYEGDYGLPCGPPPEPKLHSRGIALVRRDNAPAVRKILKTALEMMMRSDMNASEVVQAVAAYVHLLRASARSIHSTDRPAEHLAMDQFVVSGGLSKDVEDYDGPPNAAVHVACRLMELMPLEKLGAGTRVMYVVRALHKDAKRGEQACLVDDLVHNRFPLDISYYEGAVRSKLDPILSALFVVEERARRTHVGIDGRVMVVEHARASDRAALPGQVEAARRLSSAIAEHRRAAQVETVAVAPVFARMAASVAIPKALPPKKEKRKEGPQIDAFAMMKAASKVVKR
jgi:DNA polymerase elongation subunit (family B)